MTREMISFIAGALLVGTGVFLTLNSDLRSSALGTLKSTYQAVWPKGSTPPSDVQRLTKQFEAWVEARRNVITLRGPERKVALDRLAVQRGAMVVAALELPVPEQKKLPAGFQRWLAETDPP